MMIQQILPPQKPLLLHIYTTSEKVFSGFHRSFQDIPEGKFGAKKPVCKCIPTLCIAISPTDRRDTYPLR